MVWNYFFGENGGKIERQKLYLILTSYLLILIIYESTESLLLIKKIKKTILPKKACYKLF
jgi:hypothetical protein